MKSKYCKSFLMCLASGLLLGFSQPFFMPGLFGANMPQQEYLGLLAFVGYVPLFLMLRNKSLKATFWLTLATMVIQYTITLYWLFIALRDHGHVAAIPAALITLLVPLILALKGGAFFTMGRFISQHFSFSFLFIAPICLTALEYFRNFFLFGGFPWGNAGYSIGRIDEFLQLASLVGVYGLVFFIGVVNALLSCAVESASFKNRAYYAGAALALIFAVFVFGFVRLSEQSPSSASFIKVALVQGNIPQEMKNRSRIYADEILEIYLKLHRQAVLKGAELIIWPESSYPKIFEETLRTVDFPKEDSKATIVGATTYGFEESGMSYYHNSALLLNYEGQVVKRYDKTHLVPFGEYVPWPMAGVVDKVVPGMGAFKPGTTYVPVHLALNPEQKVSLGTTVCYEGIFPEIARTYARNGASLLVNITNDAWYGMSSAPYQHLLMYRLRSVESGLSFVRATNSGLTAFIDVYGKVKREFGLFERGVQVNDVPLTSKNTLYTKVGDVIPMLCLLGLLIAYILAAIPLRAIIKERRFFDIALIFVALFIAAFSYFYYSQDIFMTVESAGTKKFFIVLLCVTVLIGALVKSSRSRTILLVCGACVLTISVGLSFFETLYFLLGIIPAVLIFALALRIKGSDRRKN